MLIQSNLTLRNCLIRNKLVLRNHFLWSIFHLLHRNKELLALRNNFRATKKFLITKFDCIYLIKKFMNRQFLAIVLYSASLVNRSQAKRSMNFFISSSIWIVILILSGLFFFIYKICRYILIFESFFLLSKFVRVS